MSRFLILHHSCRINFGFLEEDFFVCLSHGLWPFLCLFLQYLLLKINRRCYLFWLTLEHGPFLCTVVSVVLPVLSSVSRSFWVRAAGFLFFHFSLKVCCLSMAVLIVRSIVFSSTHGRNFSGGWFFFLLFYDKIFNTFIWCFG